ncbi:hypothetical protein F5Y06DRAFT_270315 [Hypoxylon sp. FL0890]|nr:hypothetical protein F5Y06DRAFT_270315 [Hypoxylon sp. FL0890]
MDLDDAFLTLNAANWEIEDLANLREYLNSRVQTPENTNATEDKPDSAEENLLVAVVMRDRAPLSHLKYWSTKVPALLQAFAISRIARAVKKSLDLEDNVLNVYQGSDYQWERKMLGERIWHLGESPFLNERIDLGPWRMMVMAISETNTKYWTSDMVGFYTRDTTQKSFNDDVERQNEIRNLHEELKSNLTHVYSYSSINKTLVDHYKWDTCPLRNVNIVRTNLKHLDVDTPPVSHLLFWFPPERPSKRERDSSSGGEDDDDPPEPPTQQVGDAADTNAVDSERGSIEDPINNNKRRKVHPSSDVEDDLTLP